MQLPLQTFSTLVANAAAAVQGAASQLLDLTVGSTLRAILEANASMALWLQWLTLQVLRTTRAATSEGSDLDSWMADYAFSRLSASAAAGQATFSRFVALSNALVPAGTRIRTTDASQTFVVLADPTNATWQAGQVGFQLAVGVSSVTLPIQAAAVGVTGNVQAGAISLLATALPGIDSVTNSAPLSGGVDSEADASLRQRFQNYLASLSRATLVAVESAVSNVQLGLSFIVKENINPDGTAHPGNFLVVVDDGTGAPPPALLTEIALAVDVVRPVGTSFAVLAPTLLPAAISLTVTSDGGIAPSVLASLVSNAITAYVDGLPIGATLPFSRITQVAFAASSSVTNVTSVSLNGGSADLSPGSIGVIRTSAVQVN